jgi:primosomal protein N' (replication factor Y) (superfamily II helicase)
VQTYAPEHYAITLAARHDYEAFAAKELPVRRELRYPPFGQLANLIVAGLDPAAVALGAEHIANDLRNNARNVDVLGPAPDSQPKAKGEFRLRIALKSDSKDALLDACAESTKSKASRKVRCSVIVDPR